MKNETLNLGQLRAAIIEALGRPNVMNHNVIIAHDDGEIERVPSMHVDDISWSGRKTYVGTIFSFEGIEHNGTRYLYSDGSTIEADDEEWISGSVADAAEAFESLEVEAHIQV